jgi:hypothetical protein
MTDKEYPPLNSNDYPDYYMDEMLKQVPNPVFSPAGTNRGDINVFGHRVVVLDEYPRLVSMEFGHGTIGSELDLDKFIAEAAEETRILKKKFNRRKKQARARTGRRA